MTDINPLFVDLSHHDPASDYKKVKAEGIVGVIYKATQGSSYTDDTYVGQQHAAKAVGLKWGAYHFADASPVQQQINNFMRFACPDPDELFCLDWEDLSSSQGGTMSVADVKAWITGVEQALNRPGQCVLYSGNTAKELLGNTVDTFLGARRLWLPTYGSNPKCQKSWKTYWGWQFTDGVVGPEPHTISGVGPCDINSYDHGADQLIAEWATGSAAITPPQPAPDVPTVDVLITAPPGVTVRVRQVTAGQEPAAKADRTYEATQLPEGPITTGWQLGIETTVFGGKADPNKSAYPPFAEIDDEMLCIALPFKFVGDRPQALVRNTANGKEVIVDIEDVGPWMVDDEYWANRARPIAETCFKTRTPLPSGPNKGKVPTNGAGLDLSPAAAKAIGISGKGSCDWSLIKEAAVA